MKTKIILLLWITTYLQLSAQSEPWPVGNFCTLGASTQVYLDKNTPSDALIGLPRSGIFYEFSADFFQHKRWGLFGVFRWGRAADRDETGMQHFLENKYADYFVIAPRQNADPAKMRQFLGGIRYKMGNKRLQFQPGLAVGVTTAKFYPFEAAIKAPNSNTLLRTTATFYGVDYSRKRHFTMQLSEDMFYRISKKDIWLQLTGALLMVNLPYNSIEFNTQNQLTQESSSEIIKSSKFRFSGSFSLGLVLQVWD
jgi:hypothetical protein